ncbi:MAG TPA: sterol desaturase family protein [Anaerolineaceae bacterium]|nr:sterol desaturase family protein [Anaerolineaceae bacterium]
MAHWPITHDKEPIRLFQSDFMEFFTHIHPAVVVVIWAPVAVGFMARAILTAPAGTFPVSIPLGYLLGLFLWTLAEYTLHRFLFHFPPKTPRQEKVFFLFHGVHHAQPQCKTRLVMPPVLSIPMGLLFYGLFNLVAGLWLGHFEWVAPLLSGFITGYLAYDLTHYATHHFPMRSGVFRFLKRYHMQHHYKTPNQRFGVSSPLWDVVFRTMPE